MWIPVRLYRPWETVIPRVFSSFWFLYDRPCLDPIPLSFRALTGSPPCPLTPLYHPLTSALFPPLPYGTIIRMVSHLGLRSADNDQPTCSLGALLDRCRSAARCNPHSPRAKPHLDRGRGGSILACGSESRFLGATPSPPGLVGLGLDYKNVPDIPVNTTSIFSLRLVSVKASPQSRCRGSSCSLLSLLTLDNRPSFFAFFYSSVSGFESVIIF
jgi:hypothetical protein